ncbi:MAG: helix-turn-helix transcriptional regulator [Mangrovicoccus sp.]|nr:helix-turn-helix transcriptional regulator [Mangrovicoccus sp.]
MRNRFTADDFGNNLRSARKAQGYSQESFAHAVDLDRTYIGGIERGERNPGLKTVIKIADALNLDVADLFRLRD